MKTINIMKNEKTLTQFNMLASYDFDQTAVLAGMNDIGQVIALKPIVENLGLNWSAQLRTIKNNPKLHQLCHSIPSIGADGIERKMVCMYKNHFNDWLWDMNPNSDHFNTVLWKSYKKGLIIYLLDMLKISLDEIQRLRSIEKKYNSLKSKVGMMLNIEDEVTESRKISREKNLEKKMIAKSLQESLFESVNQLSLED